LVVYNTILITGASSGIGRALALQYAQANIHLLLTGRNKKRLEQVVTLCTLKGARVESKIVDIRHRDDVKNWLTKCYKKSPIDLIFANAGVSGGTADGKESEEQIYNIFDTNIYGVLHTIEPLIPLMIKRKKGYIALISSMASLQPMPSSPAYSATKVCVRYYGHSLRNYLKQFGISVSVICPGFIKTPLTDMNNFKMPFLMSAEKAANIIQKGINKKKGTIAFPMVLFLLLRGLNLLPGFLRDFILRKIPGKR